MATQPNPPTQSDQQGPTAPQNLSPEGRQLLTEIMRERVEKIGTEIARLETERRRVVEWLAANDTTTGGAA